MTRTVDREAYRRRWPKEGTVYRDVLELFALASDMGEHITDANEFCAWCGRGRDEGLRHFVRWAGTEAEIDRSVGLLNAIDKYMARKPGDEFVFALVCPCCSFEGCPGRGREGDPRRWHELEAIAGVIGSLLVESAMRLPGLVAVTTTPDHPAFMATYPGGPVLPVAPDATCWLAIGGNIERIDGLDGVRVITGYQEAGACGQPQCRDLRAEAQAEHAGDPDDCSSLCPICFPRALVPVAA